MNGERKRGLQKWQLGLGVAIALAMVGVGIYFLAANPVRAQVVRDLLIILLALEVLAVGMLLGVLAWQIYCLVRTLQEEVLPILKSSQEAANTVKGTAAFVGDHVIRPIAKASGYLAGLREAAMVLTGRSRNGRSS
ncbi:MAG: hypothetical protein RML36_00945 [Anaerolineae bacterium]|nr:hypothetical protein [Anaerolineae bacterium]MDW8098034.1 hypothetical protein [Anaerolineae bacterium]